MKISVPKLSLVVLHRSQWIGERPRTFARTRFLPTEVLSSDACRALVSDERATQEATNDCVRLVLHFIAAKRLERGLP